MRCVPSHLGFRPGLVFHLVRMVSSVRSITQGYACRPSWSISRPPARLRVAVDPRDLAVARGRARRRASRSPACSGSRPAAGSSAPAAARGARPAAARASRRAAERAASSSSGSGVGQSIGHCALLTATRMRWPFGNTHDVKCSSIVERERLARHERARASRADSRCAPLSPRPPPGSPCRRARRPRAARTSWRAARRPTTRSMRARQAEDLEVLASSGSVS